MRDGVLNRRTGAAVASLLASVLVVGVAAAPASVTRRDPAALTALVAEWSVVPSSSIVAAGMVRLKVRNLGASQHEIVVARTNHFADTIRLSGDHAAARTVAPAVFVEPGEVKTIELNLAPGSYVLLDNLPWHYWAGTRAAILVR